MKTIAFLSNKLTLRGCEVALYDYAHYNETILKNKSVILTRAYESCKNEMDTHIKAYEKFQMRFSVYYYKTKEDIDFFIEEESIDILYIIKYGNMSDGLHNFKCFTFIHCVFDTTQPHGNIYATISDDVNKQCKTNIPVLPHIITVHSTNENLRKELNIPESATVFGSMSGEHEFNIQYIRQTLIESAKCNSNLYFVLVNIRPFISGLKNVIFLPGTIDTEYKRKFINTCDAQLYGRESGETFGLTCGEFSLCDKPVIAKTLNIRDNFHLKTLKENVIGHNNAEELFKILNNWQDYKKDVSDNDYKKYTPEKVMKIFEELIQ